MELNLKTFIPSLDAYHMPYVSEFASFDLPSYFYSLVRQIPVNKVSTYMDLAIALGDTIAARAVGKMLSENPEPDITECFRIIHSDGSVGNYTHPLGTEEKIRRLVACGIKVEDEHVMDFEKLRFTEFKTEFPLKRIAAEQSRMSKEFVSEYPGSDSFGAVDVSYYGNDAVAAFVWREGNEIMARFARSHVTFPYIPTYLSYREGEIMKRAIGNFDGTVLVDGHGIYHPRFCGLACYIGITAGIPTIGVGKSKLKGNISGKYIMIGDRKVAMIHKGRFLSPGNRIDLLDIEKIVNHDDTVLKLTDEAHKAATHFKNTAIKKE